MSAMTPLGPATLHLCIDMQRLFSTEGPWPTPWMERVLPVVARLRNEFPSAPSHALYPSLPARRHAGHVARLLRALAHGDA